MKFRISEKDLKVTENVYVYMMKYCCFAYGGNRGEGKCTLIKRVEDPEVTRDDKYLCPNKPTGIEEKY